VDVNERRLRPLFFGCSAAYCDPLAVTAHFELDNSIRR
jgi:hypothetical protein